MPSQAQVKFPTNNDSDELPVQWVTLTIDEETYGINVMQVQEVLRVPEISEVPGAPSYVLGIVNLRGNVVTVIDTRKRFGLKPQPVSEASQIVIMESHGQVIGILVDKVADVIELPPSKIEPAPDVGSDKRNLFIQGVYSQDDKLLILVDLDKLLSDKEWEDVASV